MADTRYSLSLLALGGALLLIAAAPPAGTRIANQASATYFNISTGFHETLLSNAVNILVLPQEALLLTQDQTVQRIPGARVNLPHRVTNTGNTSLTATLHVVNSREDDYDLNDLAVYRDVNGNGIVDSGEPLLRPGETAFLNPGASIDLVISGVIPPTVPVNQQALVILTATSSGHGVQATNRDTIRTVDGAVIPVSKSASTTTPLPDTDVSFTLIGINNGSATATGIPTVVDGQPLSLVVLRDGIPANTTLVNLDHTNTGTPLYHRMGDPQHTYTSTPPADLAQVDAVGRGLPSLPVSQRLTLRFTVAIHANATGSITNTGRIEFAGDSGANGESSNTVELNLPAQAPTIQYFTDPSFTSLATSLSIGQPLFVQADAAVCNTDATTVETHVILITSGLTGDMESFVATETEANSGVFRIDPPPPTQDGTIHPAQPDNGIVETQPNDILTASLEGCGATLVETVILIDPFGIVFDSRTNEPIEGATVTLIDVTGQGNAGQAESPATVFEGDGVTPAPNTLLTDPAGMFEFPLVFPSTYRLVVTAPAGYTFPSVVPPALLPPDRTIDTQGSYGGTFAVERSAVRIDIPMDRELVGGLFVQKRAAKNVVELGDFLDYTVEVKNTRNQIISGVVLTDNLPAGFALQAGTVRIDGERHADPQGSPGPALSFALGTLPADTTVTLTYRVRIGPGALAGDGTNRAQAHSAPPLVERSNIASSAVEVRGGVFSDKGFIIGKVYVDCNRNRLQDAGEPGIPGVRLYLEDGTFAITDTAGKYNFFGIIPRTHVVKVDSTTLPSEAVLVPLSPRHGGDARSRFVDLKNRELHKADFAEGSCTPDILEAVETRRIKANAFIAETERELETELRPQGEPEPAIDPRSRPSSGFLGGDVTLPRFESDALSELVDSALPAASQSPLPATPTVDLPQVLPQLDNTLGFIDLQDGDTLAIPQTNVRVKSRTGMRLSLTVNGKEVPEKRIGKKSVLPQKQVQAWEYVGVNLTPGSNTLEVTQHDPFGNVRGQESITVVAPDKLGAIRILLSNERPQADGATPVEITVQLEDAKGVPVTVRTPVTLEASQGLWQVDDLIPSEPGTQVFIEGGSGTFPLLPPHTPGEALVRATSGLLQTEIAFSFLPELRPLLAVGVIEGIINVHKLDTKALIPAREQDSFERELRELTFTEDDGKVRGGGRAAFFLKGKIKGDYLLTLAYDSDKDTKERLFRDIQPDQFYPVYGDSSVRGFDAQSTGRVFVRVDKDTSYLLYGDFTTQTYHPSKRLGQYSRSLTGAKLHYENRHVRLNAFGSRDDSRQVVEELPGRGISGPYALSNINILENSEKVEILTRDRSQPSIILDRVPQIRFEDYEIDALSGELLFKAPVPSLDANLNPIVIRVTYEVEQGGEDFWVAGVDGQVRVTDFFEVGGTYARDENPRDPFHVVSGNATLKLLEETYLIGEVAQTERDSVGDGLGWRAEFHHRGERLNAKVETSHTSENFANPSSFLGPGRFEVRAKGRYALSDRTHVIGEALHTEDVTTGGRRDGGQLTVAQNLGYNAYAELGIRHARETALPAQTRTDGVTPFESTSLRAKIGGQMPYWPKLSLYGEYEQDVAHLDRRMAAVGGEYQVLQRGRIYARHELISSLAGRFSLNSGQTQHITLVGADLDYIRNGQLFSEYRIRDAINGRDAQAAMGLRHRFRIAEGLYLNAGFERIQTVQGSSNNDSTALTGALAYTAHERWKGTTRLELRENRGDRSLLHTLGLAYSLHRNLSLLGKHTLLLREHLVRERLRFGAAFRDTETNVWHALFRYEFRYEDDDQLDMERQVHILASNVSYQPLRPVVLNGYVASKWVVEDRDDIRSTSNTHLLSGRVTYDIATRWDAGLIGSALFSGDFASVEYGLGVEAGMLVSGNLWLSVGYNFFGFYDEDLDGVSETNPGAFLRFRYKFDEKLLHDAASKVTQMFGNNQR